MHMNGSRPKASTTRGRSTGRFASSRPVFSFRTERTPLLLAAALGLSFTSACTALSVGVSEETPLTKFIQVSQAYKSQGYRIAPGDQLSTRCYYNPQLDEDLVVRPDGNISLSLIGEMRAAGKTAAELSNDITNAYAQYFVKPASVIIVRQFTGNRVFTAGELRQPGQFNLLTGARTVLDAISASGGITPDGTLGSIILIRRLPDMQRPMVAELDIADALSGDDPSQDVVLMPNDFIYVPRSGIVDFNYAMQQYVFRTLNFSANAGVTAVYELNPNN